MLDQPPKPCVTGGRDQGQCDRPRQSRSGAHGDVFGGRMHVAKGTLQMASLQNCGCSGASAANISTMRRALSAAWAAAARSLTRATSKRSPPISVASIKSVIAWIRNALAAASRASARPTMACTVSSSRRRALLPRRAFLAALAARCVPRLSALQDSATAPANRHLHASRRTRIAGTDAPEWLQSIRGGRSAMARSRTPLRLAVVAAGRYERGGTRGHSPGCGWSLPSLHFLRRPCISRVAGLRHCSAAIRRNAGRSRSTARMGCAAICSALGPHSCTHVKRNPWRSRRPI
jgi:hypothetical protein